MKFTEGYWEKNERANAIHAAQAFIVEKIPHGMYLRLQQNLRLSEKILSA